MPADSFRQRRPIHPSRRTHQRQRQPAQQQRVATDTPIPAIGQVSGLTVALSEGSVSLTWDAPADGDQVSGYRIWRRRPDLGEDEDTVIVDDTGSTSDQLHR